MHLIFQAFRHFIHNYVARHKIGPKSPLSKNNKQPKIGKAVGRPYNTGVSRGRGVNAEEETELSQSRETDGIFLESKERLNCSVGRGRCCLEDEFSVKEGRQGWSVVPWAREEKIEGWMTEES